ncbi:MAG TPA: L-seryl-tRNA(Sec) selenium transferase [Pyrinomonadaceae bacterium]|jgi:L-seryl-tRNA(Ser) seleniumtransferase|nr:L-seryl-tRNA(Sec) selenium transferase [Pyrinomonadaceae bacterium]
MVSDYLLAEMPGRPLTERLLTERLRALPSVDAILHTPEARVLRATLGAERLTTLARAVTEEMRAELRAGGDVGVESNVADESVAAKEEEGAALKEEKEGAALKEEESAVMKEEEGAAANGYFTREALLAEGARRLARVAEQETTRRLRRVVNATGVILHTNLGRAPLSEAARRSVVEEAAGYCTLEYDTETGARGRRGARAESLLAELTGAEDALVVNNCAAAALLVLASLARGGETIVSRGELVEIGGDFRVPDVMEQSGTTMIEVGTTNRTKLSDYERAVTERTRLVLRVHPSNYRIVGFTSAPTLAELARLARERNLLLYEDAGSGALLDLGPHGLAGEPFIRESIARGADVVTFSGDKLLGAAQSGLVVGRRETVERLRRHPLYRALRADKLALAALEATLGSYRRGAAVREVPVLRMLAATRVEIKRRVRAFCRRLRPRLGEGALAFEIVEGESAIGGGSAPTTCPPTMLLALTHAALTASALEERLRRGMPPVIARILQERVVIDLRTVSEDEEAELLDALVSVSSA